MRPNIPSTKKQNAMIGYQISKLKLDQEIKEEMIWMHSDGRTTHISELYFDEATKIITALLTGQVTYVSPKVKMTRKILSMAHELNWELADGRVDIDRVDNWCKSYGYLYKSLNLYTESELPALVTAFENMYLKHLKQI